jgi:hypothetical protein
MVWSLLALHQPWLDAAIEQGSLSKSVPAELMQLLPNEGDPSPDVGESAPATTM